MNILRIEGELLKRGIDINARVDMPNGGIYLKNLIKDICNPIVRKEVLEISKEIQKKYK